MLLSYGLPKKLNVHPMLLQRNLLDVLDGLIEINA